MAKSGVAALAPPLDAKSLPSRQRGKDTFEAILATAGDLLAEVGFERLTTNLVCERAGLTPPALYRYFPNKYALLAELAARLMDAQDEVFLAWMEEGGLAAATMEESVRRTIDLRRQVIAVTRAQPGGMWILRAIRALPLLKQVRVASRDKVLERHFALMRTIFPDIAEERLRTAVRLSEEMTYATIEMILEDPQLDEEQVIEEGAWMTTLYFLQMPGRYGRGGAPPPG